MLMDLARLISVNWPKEVEIPCSFHARRKVLWSYSGKLGWRWLAKGLLSWGEAISLEVPSRTSEECGRHRHRLPFENEGFGRNHQASGYSRRSNRKASICQ